MVLHRLSLFVLVCGMSAQTSHVMLARWAMPCLCLMLLAAALTLGKYCNSLLNELSHLYYRVLIKWILCHIIYIRGLMYQIMTDTSPATNVLHIPA